MWELEHNESWELKNWCFWAVVLEKTLESPLDYKIKPVNPQGNQSWIFIGRTDAEAEAPVLWPPDVKNCLTGKDCDVGKDWRQEETTEDEMVGWLDGHEFEQDLGVGDGQGSLAWYIPWGFKKLDMTKWLNWTKTKVMSSLASLDILLSTVTSSYISPFTYVVASCIQKPGYHSSHLDPFLQWLKKKLFFWLHHMACWILVLGPGIKPVSLALAGGFLTTGQLGKSLLWLTNAYIMSFHVYLFHCHHPVQSFYLTSGTVFWVGLRFLSFFFFF